MKTLIIIPAYNEENNIETLVKQVISYGYDYLIINDSSEDNTALIAEKNKYNIINLSANIGLAGVTQIGFKYANDNGYDCVVNIDGDGQHQPKYIKKLVAGIEDGNDYIIGSRFIDEKKPFTTRMIGSRILSILMYIKTHKWINDPTSGMRALGKKIIREFNESMNFYAEPDTVCYLIKKGYKIEEVQVEMLERKNGISYFANPLRSIKFMLAEMISIIFIQ